MTAKGIYFLWRGVRAVGAVRECDLRHKLAEKKEQNNLRQVDCVLVVLKLAGDVVAEVVGERDEDLEPSISRNPISAQREPNVGRLRRDARCGWYELKNWRESQKKNEALQ